MVPRYGSGGSGGDRYLVGAMVGALGREHGTAEAGDVRAGAFGAFRPSRRCGRQVDVGRCRRTGQRCEEAEPVGGIGLLWV